MNWLLIVVIVILLLSIFNGYRRGFLRIMFSLCALVLTFILVTIVSPKVSDFLEKETKLYKTIETSCIEKLESAMQDGNSEEGATPWIEELVQISGYEIPEELKSQLGGLGIEGADSILEQLGLFESIGKYLAKLILNAISFAITFLVITLLLKIVIHILDIIAKIPIINGLNRFSGMLAGLLQGILIIWLGCIAILIFNRTPTGQVLMEQISSNMFLSFLYSNNYLLKLVTGII